MGIAFRVSNDAGQYEGFYIRPLNSNESDQARRNHTVQYFSQPGSPWHVLRETSPGAYESWADIETG